LSIISYIRLTNYSAQIKLEGLEIQRKMTLDWSDDILFEWEAELVINRVTYAIMNPGMLKLNVAFQECNFIHAIQ